MAGKAIVGKKVGMTQIWDEDNRVIPVTVVQVPPCRVVQIKTQDRDGYSALQVTQGTVAEKNLNQPQLGHFDKAGGEPGKQLIELRVENTDGYEIGQEIAVDLFNEGDIVDVSAVSKGKGFAGVMKRHGFAGQRASHGAHKVHRKPGAIGQCATPSRVFQGKKMPGRMGSQKTTIMNLTVVRSDLEGETILIKGAVPGPRGATVVIRNAVKVPVSSGDNQ